MVRIHGTSGIGKSRIAFESLKDLPGAQGHVIYTEDEAAAIQLAYDLANGGRSGILVVDRCSEPGSDRLSEILGGSIERVRVISIHSQITGEAPAYQGALWLAPMQELETEKVLQQNFQNVPFARIRAYSRLAGGSVSFAISLARHDGEFSPGDIPRQDAIVDKYFRYSLSDEQQEVAAAIAVVDAIGYRGSVASELSALAELTGFAESELRSRALDMQTVPGIVGVAGRYLHVYPPALASRAFLSAWTRWSAPIRTPSWARSHPMPCCALDFYGV